MGATITSVPESIIKRQGAIKFGVRLHTSVGSTFTLGKKITEGGEGCIYAVSRHPNEVAKIYFEEKCTERRKAKLERILSLKINDAVICAPTNLLYNKDDIFVGYLMPMVKGADLRKLLYNYNEFSSWTRRDLVKLCLSILKAIYEVYSINKHDILVGDVNRGNFIINSADEVSIIDFDSIQIDEFPCPVGDNDFTAPELLSTVINRKDSLRTENQEAFSIALLLFLILLNNKHPFSYKGGLSPAENIIKGYFPYNEDGTVASDAPTGCYPYIWAALPVYIRRAFIQSFTKKQRVSVRGWIALFEQYLFEYDSIIKANPFLDNRVIDRYYDGFGAQSDMACKFCHKPTPQSMMQNGLCFSCLKSGVTLARKECSGCGKQISIYVLPGEIRHASFYCDECLKNVDIACHVCGTVMHVHNHEIKNMQQNGNVVCPSCSSRLQHVLMSVSSFQGEQFRNVPFGGIDFKQCFEKLMEFSKKNVQFLEKYKVTAAQKAVDELRQLYWLYFVQKQLLPKYQCALKDVLDISSTKSLNSEMRKLTTLKNDAAKDCLTLIGGKQIKLSSVPAYPILIKSIDSKKEQLMTQFKCKIESILAQSAQLEREFSSGFKDVGNVSVTWAFELLQKFKSETDKLTFELENYSSKEILAARDNCKERCDVLGQFVKFARDYERVVNAQGPSDEIEATNFDNHNQQVVFKSIEALDSVLRNMSSLISTFEATANTSYASNKNAIAFAKKNQDQYTNLRSLVNCYLALPGLSHEDMLAKSHEMTVLLSRCGHSCSIAKMDRVAFAEVVSVYRDFAKCQTEDSKEYLACLKSLSERLGRINLPECKFKLEIDDKISTIEKEIASEERRNKVKAFFGFFCKAAVFALLAGIALYLVYLFLVYVLPVLISIIITLLKVIGIILLIVLVTVVLWIVFDD